MTTKSQNAQVADFLAKGGTLTPLEAWQRFGIERLASRVYDCKKLGMAIESRMIKVIGAHGPARVAQYALAKREGA